MAFAQPKTFLAQVQAGNFEQATGKVGERLFVSGYDSRKPGATFKLSEFQYDSMNTSITPNVYVRTTDGNVYLIYQRGGSVPGLIGPAPKAEEHLRPMPRMAARLEIFNARRDEAKPLDWKAAESMEVTIGKPITLPDGRRTEPVTEIAALYGRATHTEPATGGYTTHAPEDFEFLRTQAERAKAAKRPPAGPN